tara:strand:- start:2126 stop:2869 length:744 start_codon:yes stop_codon:yes gene_type:complete
MLKAFTQSAPVQNAVAWILANYMRLCAGTKRWDQRGREHLETVTRHPKGVVAAFWHSRIGLSFVGWDMKARQRPTMLISRSREGEFIARFARVLNIAVVRGSSRNARKDKDKGGLTAFRAMTRAVENDACMGLTIDGPRGPRQRASLGALKLAQATGAPILIFSWSVTNKMVAKSWDRFVLPYPFGRGVIIWKEPLFVPADADADRLETLRLELENRLNDATREADEACGGPVIEPAEPRHAKREVS